jgi:hypothetical protein
MRKRQREILGFVWAQTAITHRTYWSSKTPPETLREISRKIAVTESPPSTDEPRAPQRPAVSGDFDSPRNWLEVWQDSVVERGVGIEPTPPRWNLDALPPELSPHLLEV